MLRNALSRRVNLSLAAAALLLLIPVTSARALVGDPISQHRLEAGNDMVRGLAFDPVTSRLFVLDATSISASLYVYQHSYDPAIGLDSIQFLYQLAVPDAVDSKGVTARFTHARGLAFAVENGDDVLYSLVWTRAGAVVIGQPPSPPRSELWRFNVTAGVSSFADLRAAAYDIDSRETLGVACVEGDVLITFDPSSYAGRTEQVRRGILRLRVHAPGFPLLGAGLWNAVKTGTAVARHQPTSGRLESDGVTRARSFGLASMSLDGHDYLFGTIEDDAIYAADAATGRGLFYFGHPLSMGPVDPTTLIWGLTYGNDALWVAMRVSGTDWVHRIHVNDDPYKSYLGERRVRHMKMTITSIPGVFPIPPATLGIVRHNFSHPYGTLQVPNQGFDAGSLVATDLVGGGVIELDSDVPGGHAAATQWITRVKYTQAQCRAYVSTFEFDYWVEDQRHFVYPHRANTNQGLIAGSNFTGDDATLYDLAATAKYAAFIARVRAYIEDVYDGVPADLQNPYWAARNVTEYILESYHYPSIDGDFDDTGLTDPAIGHFSKNPASFKLEFSADADFDDNIVSCSPASVMVAGALRYLDIPARWIGSAHQPGTGTDGAETWDANGNGFLDGGERASGESGSGTHRWAEVWLGDEYRWMPFDATPAIPENDDYAGAPAVRSQWDFMKEAVRVTGAHEVVTNIGSEKKVSMFREDELYPGGGDQWYVMRARYSDPTSWIDPAHTFEVTNACSLDGAAVSFRLGVRSPVTGQIIRSQYDVAWTAGGRWDLHEEATLDLYLEKLDAGGTVIETRVLGANVDPRSGSFALALEATDPGTFRVKLVKHGDEQTGAFTATFTN